jgi:MFS family permease
MPSPSATDVNPARLCALNTGLQLVWGAVLAVSLQERSIALAGHSSAVALYAIVAAGGALVATFVQLFAGAWSDHVRRGTGNRQAFYAAGIALSIPTLVWFYLAPDLRQFVIAFGLLQIGMNVVGGPYQAVIADFVPAARRGLASSWMAGYQSAGNAAGLVVAGVVHDLRLVALAIAVPLAASYAVSASYLRGLAPNAGSAAGARPLSLEGPLGTLLVSRGLVNVGFFTLLGFLLFFVRDALHVPARALETQTAFVFLTFTLAAIAGAALAARPTDARDKRLVVTLAIAVIVLALAGLAAATTLPVAYASAGVAGAAWGAFVTADWALATALLPAGTLATAFGIWNVATTIPQVVAPLLTAPLVVRLNELSPGAGPRGAVVLALLEFALGGAAVWRLPRV